VLHPYTHDPDKAARIQVSLCDRMKLARNERPVDVVGEVDVDYADWQVCAAVVVRSYPGMGLLASATAVMPLDFPYIFDLLAFREGPPLPANLHINFCFISYNWAVIFNVSFAGPLRLVSKITPPISFSPVVSSCPSMTP
jgi:hypothetical protein